MREPIHRTQYRIPARLADWLKERAARNGRSMNGELVQLLSTIQRKEGADHAQA